MVVGSSPHDLDGDEGKAQVEIRLDFGDFRDVHLGDRLRNQWRNHGRILGIDVSRNVRSFFP